MTTIQLRSIYTTIITLAIGVTMLLTNVQQVSAAPAQVINGSDVAENEHPWMVGLLLANVDDAYSAQFCGGTLIDAEWVLTAAHCTFDLDFSPFAARDLEIIIGSRHLRNGTGTRIAIDQIIRHRDFDSATYYNDIALLRLATPLQNAPVVTIDDGSAVTAVETEAAVVGWGITEQGVGADTLRQANLPVVSYQTCAQLYEPQGYIVADTMLCAGNIAGGVDACAGDSGGPLVIWEEESQTWVQAGIVSAGAGCAEPGYYGLYTQLSDYVSWIGEAKA